MAGTPLQSELVALIEPVVAEAGYDLETVAVSNAGRRSLVRVVIDGDAGVSLDAVAEVSRAISRLLDAQDALLGSSPYLLEVTSPGVDRPLRQPRHWRRSVGRKVRVSVAGLGSVEGRITGADEDRVRLEVGGVVHDLDYAALGPGSVQVEFNRPEPDGEEEQL